MPSKKDSKDPFEIRGLTEAQLAKIKKMSRYEGPPKRPFFERAVWWWRPLLSIVGKNCNRITIPNTEDRLFFPESVFLDMREAQRCGELHLLLDYWFERELCARLSDVFFGSWPAFTLDARITYMGLSSDEVHVVKYSSEIDLGRSDKELCSEFMVALKKMREERRERIPGPVDDRVRRSSYLSEHSFGRIELIDERKSLNQTVGEDAWANVNKAVRLRRWRLSLIPSKYNPKEA